MARRMLIDASHPEETRVVVVDGTRLEEFDFETASRKPLKGNIYLAKVIRIEPSLQAAFVEYGGNRHGFLAFSEIHPDYYRIPVADREALLAQDEAFADHADELGAEPDAAPGPVRDAVPAAESPDPAPETDTAGSTATLPAVQYTPALPDPTEAGGAAVAAGGYGGESDNF